MKTNTKIQEIAFPKNTNIKKMVYGGMAVLALVVSMYMYFVGKIVFDVVGRRTAEASIKSSQSSISSLEVAYYKQLKNLDLSNASAVGLSESSDTLYASRTTDAARTVGMAHEL